MEKNGDSMLSFGALVTQLVVQHLRELQESRAEVARLNDLMLDTGQGIFGCDSACKTAPRAPRPVFEIAPRPLLDAVPPPCAEETLCVCLTARVGRLLQNSEPRGWSRGGRRAFDVDLAHRDAQALGDPENHLPCGARCGLHRFSPESVHAFWRESARSA